MGEKFELSYLDLCRLSQAYNRDANPAEPGTNDEACSDADEADRNVTNV